MAEYIAGDPLLSESQKETVYDRLFDTTSLSQIHEMALRLQKREIAEKIDIIQGKENLLSELILLCTK